MKRPEFIFTFQNSCDNVAVSTFTPSNNGGKQAFTITGYDVSKYLDTGDELVFFYNSSQYIYTVIDITGSQITMNFDYNAALTNVNTYLQFSIKTSCNPFNFNRGQIIWERGKDQVFYMLKYNGALKFTGTDYSYIKFALDDNCCRITFKIYRLCGGGYSLLLRSYLANAKETWDESKCFFESDVLPVNKYDCINNVGGDMINIYEAQRAQATYRNDDYFDADADPSTPNRRGPFELLVRPVAPAGGGTLYTPPTGSDFTEIDNAGYVSDPNTGNPWAVYAREVKYITYTADINFVTPSYPGYDYDSEIRADNKAIVKYTRVLTVPLERQSEIWGTGGICDPVGSLMLIYDPVNDNCIGIESTFDLNNTSYSSVYMRDVLMIMAGKCGGLSSINSDFFEINAIGDTLGYSPGVNYVTGEYNFLANLKLCDLSDVKNPMGPGVEPTETSELSFDMLMKELMCMFNAFWFIDARNRLRIEHYSWFINMSIINVSTYNYNKALKAYAKEKSPRRESFSFRYQFNIDFVGTDIVYPDGCSADPVTLYESAFTTDLRYIRENINQSFTGLAMLCTDGLIVKYDIGKLSGVNIQNVHLSWANLHYNYHQYRRALPTGLMNYEITNFVTWKKLKLQNNQKYLGCCLNIPDTIGTVTTELGVGDAVKITYDINSSAYTFELEV